MSSPRRQRSWACLVALAVASCSSSSSNKDGTSGTVPDEQGQDGLETGAGPMTEKPGRAALTIYGMPLGAPFQDGLSAARETFSIAPDGDSYATARATIDGMTVTGELMARDGRLEDVALRFQLPAIDESLETSAPLRHLTGELGTADEVEADLAVWKRHGYEVELTRMGVWPKDAREETVEYALRARRIGPPAPTASDGDREARKKADEAAGARGEK